MLLENKSVLPGLVIGIVVLGAAIAAEPIFVTPPAKPSAERAAIPPTSGRSLSDLPLARTYPTNAPLADKPAGGVPVFVSPVPKVSAPDSVVDEDAKATAEKAPARPVRESAGVPSAESEPAMATAAESRGVQNPDKPELDPLPAAEVPAVFVPPTRGKSVPEAPAESVPETDAGIKLGLGLKPLQERKNLPLELNLLQAALIRAVESTQYLPPDEGRRKLCSEAGNIDALTRKLSQAPLIEMTTHFNLWRSAMEKLRGSTQSLIRQCEGGVDKVVGKFGVVSKNFKTLLGAR